MRSRSRLLGYLAAAVITVGASLGAVTGTAHASATVPAPAALSGEGLVTSFSPSTLASSAWNPSNSPGNCPTTNNAATVNGSGYAEIDTNGADNDCRSMQSPAASLSTAPGTTYEALLNFSSFQDWPAFWMYGSDWPNGGEIDAVEGGPGVSGVTWHQSGNYTIGPDPWDDQQVSLASGHPADIAANSWTTVDISFTTTGVDVYYNGSLYVHIPETVTTGGTDPMFLTISEGSCNAEGTNVCNGGTAPAGSVQAQYVSEFSSSVSPGATAPAVTTNAATSVADTTATLNGSVNPEGAATTYKFDYGTTTSYGTSTTASSAGSGSSGVAENAALTGLTASTTYHYRVEATNATGTTLGSDQTFTTTATGGGGGGTAPAVVTSAATSVTSTGAALNGTVNPDSLATTYTFDYGTSTSYGSTQPATPASAGSGSSATAESTTLTGLSPSTTYHYRVEATNSAGTTDGSDQTFATSASGSACTILNDSSAPARVEKNNSTATTATTASFSPPAGSEVLVQVSVGNDSGGSTAPSVTEQDSSGTSYTAGPSSWDGAGEGSYTFTHYYATAPGSITVTSTRSRTDTAMYSENTRVLTGVAASQAGAVSGTAHGNGTSTETKTLTPTAIKSDVEVVTTEANTPALTSSGLATDSSWYSAYDGEATVSGHQKTTALASETVGWHAASASNWALSALEVLPAMTC